MILTNPKTKAESGLDYVMRNLELITPYGKKRLKEIEPFSPGQENELKNELNRIEAVIGFIKENQKLIGSLQEVFMEVKDTAPTVSRSKGNTLSMVELYDVKLMLLQMRQILSYTKGSYLPDEYILSDTEALLNELDPRKDRISAFYIYEEFSPLLAEYRKKKRDFEILIRKEQKHAREELRKTHNVNLTPKFDIVVAKSNPELEKIQSLPELEIIDQDYMSITHQLKPTQKVYEYIGQMENINTEIELEEEKIRGILSRKIAEYKDLLLDNCEKIGALDFALSKGLFALKHELTKPEITTEHIIEFEEGRNLQVEDVLKTKGQTYCPVSIALRDGVTVITGANMGGKTVTLKLAGQIPILAQYGFFVPAKKARVGLSNFMQMLIGDSQSLERGLSSFGSEMEELKEILNKCCDRSLVLIDEIASGTNPTEGTALTKSLMEYLTKKPYISLITTHFETGNNIDGVVNMQVKGLSGCDFDKLYKMIQSANRRDRINTLSKFMDYSLCVVENESQVPKDALNIAAILGIDKAIIDSAKKYIDK